MRVPHAASGDGNPPRRDDPACADPASSPAVRAPRADLPGLRALALSALVLFALWALDALVLRSNLLAPLGERAALTPLYAFWLPRARPETAVFVGLAVAFTARVAGLADPARTRSARYGLELAAWTAALAFALTLVRAPAEALGSNFDFYRGEEFWHDALAMRGGADFLRRHVEILPTLSTHGRHFPPGHALLLRGVIESFGPSLFAAGLFVLACAAAGVVAAWRALALLVGEAAARPAAILVATSPALLDFAATAMDAVFFALAALALWASVRAIETDPGTRALRRGILAGVALFAASLTSYSALPLGLVVALFALLRLRGGAIVLLAAIGAGFAGAAIAFGLATGFWIHAAFSVAHENARAFMQHVRSIRDHAEGWRAVLMNPVAFGLYAGIPLVAAAVRALGSAGARRAAWSVAAATTLALMSLLYDLETERVWLFALPWLAAIALQGRASRAAPPTPAGSGAASTVSLMPCSLRLLVGVALAQAVLMEAALFTLW